MRVFVTDPVNGESVVERADRPVPQGRAGVVVAVVLLVFAGVAKPVADGIYGTANRAPQVLAWLRVHPDEMATTRSPARPAVVVLLDGLRNDEATGLAALSRLARRGARAVTVLRPPTLSTPFYHAMLTGVGPDGTGVRTNRFHGRARLDSLADRVRASGRHSVFLADGRGLLARMFAGPGDRVDSRSGALGRPLDEALATLGRPGGPALVIAHFLDVDATAHAGGIHSAAHLAALRGADRLVARVARGVRGRDVVVSVIADHGHIDGGGHGGDEPVVTHAPFVLVAPGAPRGRLARALRVGEIAPTLAAWMGVAPPRSAIAVAAPELAPASEEHTMLAGVRAHHMMAFVEAELARVDQTRLLLSCLWGFLGLCALGAIKRAFHGFGPATVIAPALFVAIVTGVHLGVLRRPLTLSAIDEGTRQAVRLVLTGALAALLAVGGIALFARRARKPWRTPVRRGATAVGLVATALAGFSLAWVGGALGPWPVTPYAFYAPALWLATMAGANPICAGALILCARGTEHT